MCFSDLAGDYVRRMQKTLVEMNLQLPLVVSNIVGKTGLAILRDLVAGQRDPQVLAQHRDPHCQATPAEIAAALTGHYRAEHLLVLQQNLELFDMCQTQLRPCDGAIDAELNSCRPPSHRPRRRCPAFGSRAGAAMNPTSTSGPCCTT